MTVIDKDCRDLKTWLLYLESIDMSKIKLGLERVGRVCRALGLDNFADKKVITVAGTNGKGSTCAFIAQALYASGYTTGLYTSPHLIDFTERISINQQQVDDTLLCEAFSRILQVSKIEDTALTYFEFTTLAALYCFKKSNVDVLVLEVGLGGRLDAVNIIDADLALISSIGLDHVQILGDSIEKIAYEKAGIIKDKSVCILGSVENKAFDVIHRICLDKKVKLLASGIDFKTTFVPGLDTFDFSYSSDCGKSAALCVHEQYVLPKIPFECVGIALCALKQLQVMGFVIKDKALEDTLLHTALPCRMQKIAKSPDVYIDVAHNEQAARHLHMRLTLQKSTGSRRKAVVAMLKDKDIEGVIASVHDLFDVWYVASSTGVRGEDYTRLENAVLNYVADTQSVRGFDDIEKAIDCALQESSEDDEIIIFGSFVTAAAALKYFTKKNTV